MSRDADATGPRERRRNYPIAVHLALFALGTLMPVLLIVTVMLIDAARLRRDDALHDANTLVHHLNATIDVEIEKALAVGQTLATSRALAAGDYAMFDAQSRDVANRLGVVIVARDVAGQQLTSTALPFASSLPISNEGVLAVDRLAAETKKPVVSDLLIGTVMKTPLVIADIPVLNGSDVIYFIDVVLLPRRIAEILTQDLPEGWIAGVVGRDGRLIARSVDQDRYIGTVNERYRDTATQSEGIWAGVSREGTSIEGAYVRSALSGWRVSVAVPEEVLHAPVRWAMTWLSGLAVAALAVSLWFGWRLSRRIALPIRDLVTRARELGEGRRPVASHSSVGEVNDVTDALLAASVALDRQADAAARAMEAVRGNEERLQLVQDTAGIGTIDWDIEADRAVCSPRFYEMYSLPAKSAVHFADVLARVHPADRDRVQNSYNDLAALGGSFEEEFRVLTDHGGDCWIHASGRLYLLDGRPVRLLGASIDITGRKLSEEHLRFLLREISHRSKNLLAVIQAMANQTAKTAESVDVFKRRFAERLMGLAASHDLLVNQDWLGVSVENLVRGQLSPFVDLHNRRLRIHGPEVDLKAQAAEALGLALHELATNSVKYGALRDDVGTLEIVWEVDAPAEAAGHDDPADDLRPDGRRFRMDWIEHTGVPVTPPSHKGFGRMVIEHTVEATLEGTVTLIFPPDGMRWRIDAPASCLVPPTRVMAD